MSNEHDTPANSGLGRDADPGAIKVANLGLVFTELGRTCAALARRVDEVSGAERAAFFAQLGSELREQADLSHDTARYFEDISRGYPKRPADPPTTDRRRNPMTKAQHLKHLLLTAFLSSAPLLIVALTGSKWGHAAWVAPAIALIRWAVTALGPQGAAAVVVWIGAAIAIGLSGCATTGTGPVATFDNCTTAAGKAAANTIVDRVMTAIASGDYIGQLGALVTQFGIDEVKCAVQLAVAELEPKATASPDPVVSTMLHRAQAWQAANP